jgi:hypothetical protein
MKLGLAVWTLLLIAPIFTLSQTTGSITRSKSDAKWEMTGAKSPEGKDIPLRKGLLNFAMTKEKESWLITVMHNMDLPMTQ